MRIIRHGTGRETYGLVDNLGDARDAAALVADIDSSDLVRVLARLRDVDPDIYLWWYRARGSAVPSACGQDRLCRTELFGSTRGIRNGPADRARIVYEGKHIPVRSQR